MIVCTIVSYRAAGIEGFLPSWDMQPYISNSMALLQKPFLTRFIQASYNHNRIMLAE